MTELRLRMAPALLAFLFATPALPRGPRAQDLAGADLEPVEVRPAAAWQARLFERLRRRGRALHGTDALRR